MGSLSFYEVDKEEKLLIFQEEAEESMSFDEIIAMVQKAVGEYNNFEVNNNK